MTRAIILMPLLLLVGCGHRNDDVGGVSPEEDRQLNEAAAALDVNYVAPVDNEFIVANAAASNETGNAQ